MLNTSKSRAITVIIVLSFLLLGFSYLEGGVHSLIDCAVAIGSGVLFFIVVIYVGCWIQDGE